MTAQFTGQGKFALLAVEGVDTNFPDEQDYEHQLPDGTWVCVRMPVPIDSNWEKWIGTIRLERLKNSNLVMIVCEESVKPHLLVLDSHHGKLKERLWQTFSLLQLSGVLDYEGSHLLCGSFCDGKSEVRQMSELPLFCQINGCARLPVTIERLEKAVQLRNAVAEMESDAESFTRLKWGWRVLVDGLQRRQGEERIHQLVRSLEALIVPEAGKTKRQFVHRCQTFARASENTKAILEEAFDLRSKAEHLNAWEQALESHPEDDRANVALHRTRQMEQLATFVYSCIFESNAVRDYFISEVKQKEFWKLPDDERRSIWGTPLELR